jgi:general nucleoside transport system ATP-binding protein
VSEGPLPVALSCRAITKRFGSVIANDDIDFDVRAGEIHGLIGENGAGKSTLMSVLYGVFPPDGGQIALGGRMVRFASCADAMRAGIGMVFQHYLLVERFSVAENIQLGREQAPFGFLDRPAALAAVREISQRYRFAIDPAAPVETLGVSARQQVELLKVLERDPQIVILDEPTAALSPLETQGHFDIMRHLRDDGRAVVFITHKLKEVMELCDRITVLRRGRVVGTTDRARASQASLGGMMVAEDVLPVQEMRQRPDRATIDRSTRPVVLEVRDLTLAGTTEMAATGVHLSCRAGEIVAIAGVEGNGQLELAESIYGMTIARRGTVWLDGIDVTRATLQVRRAAGLHYIPPDRQRDGLLLDFDAVENALLGDIGGDSRGFLVDRAAGRSRADAVAFDLAIHDYDPTAPMRRYSGGTQQKFLVGREARPGVRALIAFAPTRGVDVGAAQRINARLRALQTQGACILLISYDLDEIRALADRILVIYRGVFVGDLTAGDADDATLGRLMGGVGR